ncbi:MAG: SPOR domain-containing protein, partial [Planctomycetes bacterium]|nr:SPOR domain-containing protein [Planctomycetota bacterium]
MKTYRFGPRDAGLAAVSLLLAGGCATLPPNERQALIEASRQYARGDVSSAQRTAERIIRDYGQAAEIAEVYYLRGLCRFSNGQDRTAGDDFERAISRSKRSDLTAQCTASLAAIAYRRGDFKRAADLYRESVGQLRDVPPTDVILYCAGVAMRRAGDWHNANFQFARILNRFRDRPIAADARRAAAWRHPYFAIQLGAYRDRDNAAKLVQSMRQQGFDASQEYLPRNGESLWIVTTGHYSTHDEARAALANV